MRAYTTIYNPVQIKVADIHAVKSTVLEAVCERYQTTIEQIYGQSRKREIVIPRQVTHFLLLSFMDKASIAREFSVNHSSVINSVQRVLDDMDIDEDCRIALATMKVQIKERIKPIIIND